MIHIRSLIGVFIIPIIIAGCDFLSNQPIAPDQASEKGIKDVSGIHEKLDVLEPDSTSDPEDTIKIPADSSTSITNRVLIDGSKDGGVWWFPQAGIFDTSADHQGKAFAERLRSEGYLVDELGRDHLITEGLLEHYNIIIRANGFEPYQPSEVDAYRKAIERGITLVLLSDHKKYAPDDPVENLLGIKFTGVVSGTIVDFEDSPLTKNLKSLDIIGGSYISDVNIPGLLPLARIYLPELARNKVVMALLQNPTSRIFLMGDVNAIEFMPEPFTSNLIRWIGSE